MDDGWGKYRRIASHNVPSEDLLNQWFKEGYILKQIIPVYHGSPGSFGDKFVSILEEMNG